MVEKFMVEEFMVQEFMVQELMVEEFMVEELMVEEFMVEKLGLKLRVEKKNEVEFNIYALIPNCSCMSIRIYIIYHKNI